MEGTKQGHLASSGGGRWNWTGDQCLREAQGVNPKKELLIKPLRKLRQLRPSYMSLERRNSNETNRLHMRSWPQIHLARSAKYLGYWDLPLRRKQGLSF
jgi:hypothetical protein